MHYFSQFDMQELNEVELEGVMWLSYLKKEIELAGRAVSLKNLMSMSLFELAKMCGCNDIEIKHNRGAYHSQRKNDEHDKNRKD